MHSSFPPFQIFELHPAPENGYKISFLYFFLLGKNAKRPMEIEQTQPFKKTKQKK
jgi:hypothetical protein